MVKSALRVYHSSGVFKKLLSKIETLICKDYAVSRLSVFECMALIIYKSALAFPTISYLSPIQSPQCLSVLWPDKVCKGLRLLVVVCSVRVSKSSQ